MWVGLDTKVIALKIGDKGRQNFVLVLVKSSFGGGSPALTGGVESTESFGGAGPGEREG